MSKLSILDLDIIRYWFWHSYWLIPGRHGFWFNRFVYTKWNIPSNRSIKQRFIKRWWPCKTSLEKVKKFLIKKISSIAFEITTDIGITCTEFLDVLLLNTYCPYRKPNFKTNYINNNSNHPKNIPKMIEKRLCKISKNEKVFSSIKEFYQNALNKTNYKYS